MAQGGPGTRGTTSVARATAYWSTPSGGELRSSALGPPGSGQAEVRTLHTGISRGSEGLVHRGQVPGAVADVMRAPFQDGDFGAAVKYGYLSVGVVERLGDVGRPGVQVGSRVFCHYPHQDRYVVPVEALTPVPDAVPAARAVLAGTVETALNAVWDARPLYGDRVAVIGIGLVGASVVSLLRDFPLASLVAVDPDPQARQLAQAWGVRGEQPDALAEDFDIVMHCSGTAAGLSTALRILGFEGRVIELSWFGDHDIAVPLGAQFHARRLSIRASQVSVVAPAARARRGRQDRLALAMRALADQRYDRLLTGSSPFSALPQTMEHLMQGAQSAWCHVVDYPDDHPSHHAESAGHAERAEQES
ncbi:MAG: zinc-binding alcohol dehydrogenase [Ornithinimicrobium sp.]